MDKIENSEVDDKTLSRRKALARIGLFAAAAYSIPAFTTLSIARASSGSSSTSDGSSSGSSDGGSDSEVSANGGSSGGSDISETSTVTSPSDCETYSGDDYIQCMKDNGFELPEAS